MLDNKLILTAAQVQQLRQWQARSAQIETAMSKLRDEAADIARKLEAAKVLMGGAAEEEVQTSDGVAQEEEGVPITVLRAVGTIGGAPKPAQIRDWIKANVPSAAEKLQRTPTYLYTALLRHSQQGRLIKDGEGYRLPTSSARAGTGGVAPPAGSVT
jgi:hypothetical protein